MALVKLGPMLSELMGSVAQTTYSKVMAGRIARTRVIPRNPQTELQTDIRTYLAQSGTAWAALTDSNRQSWEDYAAASPEKNRLGAEMYLSGFNMFCRARTLRLLASLTQIDTGPASSGRCGMPLLTSIATVGGTNQISFTFGSPWWKSETNAVLYCHVTQPQPPTRTTPQFQSRYLYVTKGNSSSPPASPATATSPWGITTKDDVLWIDAYILDATGRISPPERYRVVAS